MLQATTIARDVAAWRHRKLSPVRIAGELKHGPAASATLDELLARIKAELSKLAPIIELEVVQEPEGTKTNGGLTLVN